MKGKDSTKSSAFSAEIERRRSAIRERKERMEALEKETQKEPDLKSVSTLASVSSVAEVKRCGREMLGKLHSIEREIDMVSDPGRRAQLRMALTRLCVIDIPNAIMKGYITSNTEQTQTKAVDALYEPIDNNRDEEGE